MQKILENALEIGRKYIPEGECASYIPELAKADKNHLGVCIRTRGMETFSAGDTKERFTIQSISKVITLMVALQHCGFDKVFEKMNMEPSGDAFNSLVKLDLTSDKPFNPMINAGAITTAGYLVPDVSFEDMLNYARRLCLDKDIIMDEKVFRSEMDHCARNRRYLTMLRIGHAKWMLANTACSVREIAEACGYADLSVFNRAFRALTGRTPTQWQKENR